MIRASGQKKLGEFSIAFKLAIPETGVTALFGPSGSGKTTILNCIAGLEQAADGHIAVGEHIWQDHKTKVFVPAHKRSVGYVFQDARLFPHLDVVQNIEFGLHRRKMPVDSSLLEEMLHVLGIAHLRSKRIEQLSGGEAQRVAIARAMAIKPQLLLMDEPLSGLDDARKKEVLPYLGAVQQRFGMPVIYVTHDKKEIATLADQVVVVDAGSTGEIQPVFDFFRSSSHNQMSLIDIEVVAVDKEFGLVCGAFSGGTLQLPIANAEKGQHYRVQIQATDVSIARSRSSDSSILNIFAARIERIAPTPEKKHFYDVELLVGQSYITARISTKSGNALQLQVGDQVFAQIKSTALMQ